MPDWEDQLFYLIYIAIGYIFFFLLSHPIMRFQYVNVVGIEAYWLSLRWDRQDLPPDFISLVVFW